MRVADPPLFFHFRAVFLGGLAPPPPLSVFLVTRITRTRTRTRLRLKCTIYSLFQTATCCIISAATCSDNG